MSITDDERRTDGAPRPLTVTVKTACALTGLGATKVWQLIRDGRLDVVRLDKRTLIKFPSLERLLSPEQDEQPAPRKTPRRKRLTPAEGAEARGAPAARASRRRQRQRSPHRTFDCRTNSPVTAQH